MRYMKPLWYCITNKDRIILAVYGQAMKPEALKGLEVIRKDASGTNDAPSLYYFQGEKRPKVGFGIPSRAKLEIV